MPGNILRYRIKFIWSISFFQTNKGNSFVNFLSLYYKRHLFSSTQNYLPHFPLVLCNRILESIWLPLTPTSRPFRLSLTISSRLFPCLLRTWPKSIATSFGVLFQESTTFNSKILFQLILLYNKCSKNLKQQKSFYCLYVSVGQELGKGSDSYELGSLIWSLSRLSRVGTLEAGASGDNQAPFSIYTLSQDFSILWTSLGFCTAWHSQRCWIVYMVAWNSKTNVPMNTVENALWFFWVFFFM